MCGVVCGVCVLHMFGVCLCQVCVCVCGVVCLWFVFNLVCV